MFHRPIEGVMKTCTLKRMPTGKWFEIFVCNVVPNKLLEGLEETGLDAGLKHFATLSRVHERITNKRENFCHQEARKIVNAYGIIIVEALRILNMMQNEKPSKSIADTVLGMFFSCLDSKAEEASRLFIKVSPHYTSQECCICHNRKYPQIGITIC